MDSVLLQKQIRDNAEELRSYLRDLTNWESEMKRKEEEIHSADSGSQSHPPVRSKINKLSKGQKKCENQREKLSKISGSDYASWDKFDVDKACEEVDNEEEKDTEDYGDFLSEIEEERKREEAVYEKERGNNLVKNQKWKEAIPCYSRAIKCYPHDAIFYANRALCYLKIQDLKSAEADCTTALQLDLNYVKAYQRRAMARAGLGQLLEARADLLKVMEIEPKNMASKAELTKIEKKINIKSDGKGTNKQSGTAVKSQQELKSSKELLHKAEKPLDEKQSKKSPVEDTGEVIEDLPHTSSKKDFIETNLENKATSSSTDEVIKQEVDVSRLIDTSNKITLWPTDDEVKLVKSIQKAPHLRSKKPLKRIAIQEVDNSTLIEDKAAGELSMTSTMMKNSEIAIQEVDNSTLIEDKAASELSMTSTVMKNSEIAIQEVDNSTLIEDKTASELSVTSTMMKNSEIAVKSDEIAIQEVDNSTLIEGKAAGELSVTSTVMKNSEISDKSDEISIQEVDNSTLIEDKAAGELSVTSTLVKNSEIADKSDETKSSIVKEETQKQVMNHTDPETKNIGPPFMTKTLESQNTVNKNTSTRNIIDIQSSIQDNIDEVPPVPSTSVQFYVGWKKVKSHPQLSYLYLKQIPGSELVRLFGNSLESSIFSDIISSLETHFIQFKEKLLPYMIGLTKVRRFAALVMFLSPADKAGVKKILQYCKDQGECSEEEFIKLLKTYEL